MARLVQVPLPLRDRQTCAVCDVVIHGETPLLGCGHITALDRKGAHVPNMVGGMISAMKRSASLIAVVCSAIVITATACASSPTSSGPATEPPVGPSLSTEGWRPETYDALVSLVMDESGSGKTAVFDFDNTTQARDVGEATVGQSTVDKSVPPKSIPAAVVPPIKTGQKTVRIEDGLAAYYTALAGIGIPENDPFGPYPSNTIIAQYWTGRTVGDFVDAVTKAYAGGAGEKDLETGTEELVGGFGRPFIYPQMADLYGFLRTNGYDVWVVSAGVTWAVRWMVKNALNPLIVGKYGAAAALPLDRVVGVSTLLKDKRTGEILSDYALATGKPNTAFVNLDPAELKNFQVLALPDPPNSWRGGKVGAILNRVTRERPYLAGGDSDGDFEMLAHAQNRLWITRLDKPTLQEEVTQQFELDEPGSWMLQPTISSAPVGFVQNRCVLNERLTAHPNPEVKESADQSLSILRASGRLDAFDRC